MPIVIDFHSNESPYDQFKRQMKKPTPFDAIVQTFFAMHDMLLERMPLRHTRDDQAVDAFLQAVYQESDLDQIVAMTLDFIYHDFQDVFLSMVINYPKLLQAQGALRGKTSGDILNVMLDFVSQRRMAQMIQDMLPD